MDNNELKYLRIAGVKISYKIMFWIILSIGILARGVLFGDVPGGLQQDEAYSGWEAFSLLQNGTDSWGYRFPVYFVAWGSGLNALNSYLMMPFMAIFGPQSWVIRLPQFIVAIFSLIVFYKLLTKLFGNKVGLMGLFFLSICPWHIMLSRWGLEANLAPGFLLFGSYCFLLGVEKSGYFILSSIFYGLSLYCYATVWPIVPLIILLQLIYLIYTKKFKLNINVVIAAVVLMVFAIPLLLFMMVNYGVIEEIRTSFISIPKMPEMRKDDISLSHIPKYFLHMVKVFLSQNDNLSWNCIGEFGLYYRGMLIFAAIGFIKTIRKTLKSIKSKQFDGMVFVLIQFICAVLLGCLIDVTVNRINCIHIPIIVFIIVGIEVVIKFLATKIKNIRVIAVSLLCILFLMFEGFYFTTYADNITKYFQAGIYEAIEYAMSINEDNSIIYVSKEFGYPKVAYSGKVPVTEYIETLKHKPEDSLHVYSFGQFVLDIDKPYKEKIYVIEEEDIDEFKNSGYKIKKFERTAVAYK